MLDLERARAFVDSYDRASRAGDPIALADHYGEPYTSFTLGRVGSFADRETARAQMIPWMRRFREFGLDDIRLAHCDLVPVSDSFCLCHLTFEIYPRDGGAPLRFLNIYGLRQDAAGQRFEFAISDNEIAALLRHCPEFMTGIAG
jgi:ketosteroid isomerase-like protein